LIYQEVEMKTIRDRVLCGLLIVGVPLLFLAACSGGGGGSDGSSTTSTASTTSTTGTVHLSLTDNQTLYNAVVLTIVEVGIVASDTATTYYNSTELDNLPLTVNVLDFPGKATLPLADIKVDLPENGDPVCFKQIRLVLAANGDDVCTGPEYTDKDNKVKRLCNYVFEKDDPTPHLLDTTSWTHSGGHILTPNDFCIDADDNAVQVSIDFDPAKAIVHNENNGNGKINNKYTLKPNGVRIIEGDWFEAPSGYIDGLVAVPTNYNTLTGCEELPPEPTPVVTVKAFDLGTIVDPVVQTWTLAEGPVSGADVCIEWCADEDPDTKSICETDCEVELLSTCYYSGKFKLLLSAKETYDLTATWENFGSEQAVEYNSTVLFELTEE
jgi:hypothetical protein